MTLKLRWLSAAACRAACAAALCLAWSCSAAAQTAISPQTTAIDPTNNPEYKTLFNQMFNAPTDLDVTFRFAEMATQLGDYEAAIGALERMLFYNPNLPRVRLELGVLYFKLGSYAMARFYFASAVKGNNVPPEVRAKVDAFLAEIDRRLSPSQFAAYVYTGLRYQTNANAGPQGLSVLALGQDAVLNSQFAKRPDWNWFLQTELDYAYKLGDQRGDSIEATLIGYDAQQFTLHAFDLGVAELQVGPRMPITPDASVKVYGITNALTLGDAPYLYTAGIGASARYFIGSFGLIEPLIEYRHRDFQNSTDWPISSQQTGNLLDGALNINGTISNVHWLGQVYDNYNRVSDEFDFGFNSYNQLGLEFGLPITIPLPTGEPSGVVVTPTVGGSETRYAVPDPLVDPNVTRVDHEIDFGAIIEAQIYKNIGLRVQVQEFVQHSTLPNFDMRNFLVSFGPTVRY